MARMLTPKEFGALAIMLVFINIGNVIVTSGMSTALVQSKEVDDSDFSTVFWMSLGASTVLFAALFVAAPALSTFYGMPTIVSPLRVLGILFLRLR